jgi:Arc/MetJ family transcription regulator
MDETTGKDHAKQAARDAEEKTKRAAVKKAARHQVGRRGK